MSKRPAGSRERKASRQLRAAFCGDVELLECRVFLSASPALKIPHPVPHHVAARPNVHHAGAVKTTLVIPTQTGKVRPQTSSATPPATSLSPQAIRHAYGIDNISFTGITGDGTGQTIAIADAYDDPGLVSSTDPNFLTSDLARFDAQFGLTNPVFTKLNQSGGTSYPSFDSGWSLEESLDVEWAHVIAPMAKIILVEANSATLTDLVGDPNSHTGGAVVTAAKQSGVSVVSMSFGQAEFSDELYYDTFLKTPMGHTPVTFFAASGDTGAPGLYPAYSPKVVAVGGTTLSLANTTSGDYVGETAWSSSGGGISMFELSPGYQSSITQVARYQSTPTTVTKRTIPDVAFDADLNTGVAVFDSSYSGSSTPWTQVGGTSFSSPAWAALVAIANQGRALAGPGALDGITQTLPAIYALPSTDFHDVTSGNNFIYAAAPGYDAVTGFGTPRADLLVPDLAGLSQVPISNLYVEKDGTNLDEWVNSLTPGQGTPTQHAVLADASSILFNGATGNDSLTLDYSSGNFASALTSITYNGSVSGANSIHFIGTAGDDILSLTGTGITPSGGFGSTPIALSNVQTVQLPGGSGGNDAINVSGSPTGGYTIDADTPMGTGNVSVNVTGTSTAINFASTQHLAALSVASSDIVTLTSSANSGDKLLVTASLSILGTGTLDLFNNALVVQGGDLSTISSMLTSGFAGGYWNGAGIKSSAAANDPHFLTALGVLANTADGVNPIYQTFDGYNAGPSDILVKYTYYGDADLSGTVNGADYQKIDVGFNTSGATHWSDGNFNYDPAVNGTDYSLIDNAFNQQGSPL
jgi:hypothetical protein